MDAKNKLYFGDNLKILREYVPDASVDLIYLDPPFNSSATYNVLFKEKSGEESAVRFSSPPRACRGAAQITVSSVAPLYERRCRRSQTGVTAGRESEAVYREIVESGPRKLADLMQALFAFLHGPRAFTGAPS
jgi:site-specific DNA-methyltransferase (adenine-specific)